MLGPARESWAIDVERDLPEPDDHPPPSWRGGYCDPFLAACERTRTVACLHVGWSQWSPMVASDAPLLEIGSAMFPVSSLVAAGDWFRSGVPMRFPPRKIAMSGRGIGWVPMLASADPHSDSTWPDTQQVMHERTGNPVPDRDHR